MFVCGLSGESLAEGDAVVTPSGFIASKRIIVQKMAESGGIDPFDKTKQLREEDLIALQTTPRAAPRVASSFGQLMKSVQEEYDSIVLELIDTRQALQETRQELSQALYQNDAAVRVLARLTNERNDARREVIDNDRPSKKRKVHEADLSVPKNDIPQQDVDEMVKQWETLHQGRKAQQKKAASRAPKPADLVKYTAMEGASLPTDVTVVAAVENRVALVTPTAVHVYNTDDWKEAETYPLEKVASVDINDDITVVGFQNGSARLLGSESDVAVCSSPVVAVQLHPDGTHVFLFTKNGRVVLTRVEGKSLVLVSYLEHELSHEFTCGRLHPDGLICVVGTATGKLLVWDLKSKTVASTLEVGSEPVCDVDISNNGYHIAVALGSATSVWDLRKGKGLATLNTDNAISAVSTVAFDEAGKYVAYGGADGLHIVGVKKWGTIAASFDQHVAGQVRWIHNFIVSSSPADKPAGVLTK